MSFDLSWYGMPVEEEAKEEEAIVYGYRITRVGANNTCKVPQFCE